MTQRILDPETALLAKDFPRSPKTLWKAALAAGHRAVASYSVGPWLSADMMTVLERNCATVGLWIIRADGARLRALWLRRTGPAGAKWALHRAWQVKPDIRSLTAAEMKEWITQ